MLFRSGFVAPAGAVVNAGEEEGGFEVFGFAEQELFERLAGLGQALGLDEAAGVVENGGGKWRRKNPKSQPGKSQKSG